MIIKPQDNERCCEIWVPDNERASYRSRPAYRETVEHYHNLGYQIYVYVGQDAPRSPGVTALFGASGEPQ